MRFSETVRRVIELATAINDYWEAELPKRYAKYPLVQPGETDGPPPPEQAELRDLLQSLPPEDIAKLLAVVYLGRHDYPAAKFSDRWRSLTKDRGELEWKMSGLLGYAPPVDDLLDGLEALSAAGIDVDKVHLNGYIRLVHRGEQDMSSTLQELGIHRLSIDERIALVGEIWDSIAAQVEAVPLTEPQKQEIDRRLAAHRANPDAAISWEQVESEALARLQKK